VGAGLEGHGDETHNTKGGRIQVRQVTVDILYLLRIHKNKSSPGVLILPLMPSDAFLHNGTDSARVTAVDNLHPLQLTYHALPSQKPA